MNYELIWLIARTKGFEDSRVQGFEGKRSDF